jgi:hypothetical protein
MQSVPHKPSKSLYLHDNRSFRERSICMHVYHGCTCVQFDYIYIYIYIYIGGYFHVSLIHSKLCNITHVATKAHMILQSFIVLTWMSDTIELM